MVVVTWRRWHCSVEELPIALLTPCLLHRPRGLSDFFSFATFGLDEFSRQVARSSRLYPEVGPRSHAVAR
jgi:hypothetical protein